MTQNLKTPGLSVTIGSQAVEVSEAQEAIEALQRLLSAGFREGRKLCRELGATSLRRWPLKSKDAQHKARLREKPIE